MPQDPHTAAYQHERQQGADVHELAENPDREQAGKEGHADAGIDGGEVRRAEVGMDLPSPAAEQAVARHRIEHSRLPEQHHQDHRGETQRGADIDERTQPIERRNARHGERHRGGDVQLLV